MTARSMSAVERVHQIVRFNYGHDGLRRARHADRDACGVALLAEQPRDRIAGVRAARAAARRHADRDFRARPRQGRQHQGLSDRRAGGRDVHGEAHADFDISDAALLPDGDLLLLERKFSWTGGLFIRLRHVALSAVRPDALVDGQVLLEVDLGYEIDNMEGLSVHRGASGETVLTLMSDDNFSIIQRTLLLQFTLAES